MENNIAWAQYEKRLIRVCDYIHNHLDDDLDMDILAQVACLSQYHWHRIYRAVYGETVTSTIKRLRLNRAAGDLIKLSIPIPKIAEQAGYPNLQSFNRTFKKAYGQPPGKFRAMGGTGALVSNSGNEETSMFDVKIVELDSVILAGLNHSGSYAQVGRAFEKMNGLAATRGLLKSGQRVIGIYYDDPEVIDENNLRSFAGLSVSSDKIIKPPMETVTIAGGKYAVFRYQGPYSNFESCYEWIYGGWLKTCDYQLRDEPGFAQYLNPAHTNPVELLTDIYLPLQ
ncbi:MAG: AraC family transcriptional regulator [Hyphomicrobiales bacterium]|nr:AraC family transcriptional regulator [Hyphomicrobiales bacterium]